MSFLPSAPLLRRRLILPLLPLSSTAPFRRRAAGTIHFSTARRPSPNKNLLRARNVIKDIPSLSRHLSPDQTLTLLPDQATGFVAASQANFMRVIVDSVGDSDSGEKVGTQLLCVVRALLKKIRRRVLVGDRVLVGWVDWVDRRGMIEDVFERKTEVIDPPVANVDHFLVLFSLEQPKLEPFTLTRFLVEAESTGIPLTLVLNKCELANEETLSAWKDRLRTWGYEPLFCSVESKSGLALLEDILKGKTTVVVGPSGVGKSSLINFLRSDQHNEEIGDIYDGMSWLLNSPEQSLAFVLANKGYDVWVGNIRGTRSSRRHVSLKSSEPAYWAWSWDELAANDFPAMVDLVSKQTKQKLHYVGHSLGTLIALASFSEGRMVDKLRSAALLSPIAYLDHMKTKLGILAAKLFVGEILSNLLGMAEFDPKGLEISNCLNRLCGYPGVNCYDLLTAFTGNNCCLNGSTVELFLKYEPQPTSTKNMVHLAQTFRDGTLTKYNYGDENFERYGESTPPVYNLSNIPHNLPLYLGYGGRDYLSDAEDVGHLLDDLKLHQTDKMTVNYVQNYAHADFIMGVTATQMVYDSMIAFFGQH